MQTRIHTNMRARNHACTRTRLYPYATTPGVLACMHLSAPMRPSSYARVTTSEHTPIIHVYTRLRTYGHTEIRTLGRKDVKGRKDVRTYGQTRINAGAQHHRYMNGDAIAHPPFMRIHAYASMHAHMHAHPCIPMCRSA